MYEIDDIILSEYGTTVVGLEMLRSVSEESAEESRKEHIVQSAISTLSYSELEAIIHIFSVYPHCSSLQRSLLPFSTM